MAEVSTAGAGQRPTVSVTRLTATAKVAEDVLADLAPETPRSKRLSVARKVARQVPPARAGSPFDREKLVTTLAPMLAAGPAPRDAKRATKPAAKKVARKRVPAKVAASRQKRAVAGR